LKGDVFVKKICGLLVYLFLLVFISGCASVTSLEYDDLELDTLGEQKTALFVIISDTEAIFNFVVSIMYSQLFNLLCGSVVLRNCL